jgi:hypothetical protein
VEPGERVAFNTSWQDTEGQPIAANEVGHVAGHMGPGVHGEFEVVVLDHGMASNEGPRTALVPKRYLREVRVARPGTARRSRPRRTK